MSVLLETTKGNIVLDVFTKSQPLASYNFLKLCKINHYFFSPFYDLDKDTSVKCGLPEYPSETGIGKAITSFVDITEFSESAGAGPRITVETVESVESQNDVGLVYFELELGQIGSAFGIALGNTSGWLHFGAVREGFAVLETINSGVHTQLLHTHVLYDPFGDPELEPAKKAASVPTETQMKNYIELGGLLRGEASAKDVEGSDDTTFQALALELVGDLSHYKIKPSPSTLFVARLNPITTEDSLEIFFSRYGAVDKVNVISGKKTRYAFVQYLQVQSANSAYSQLSMGCIIDGNNVLVDFSQSTTKSKQN